MAKKSDPVVEQLARVPLFATLSKKELIALAAMARPHSYAAGETIVEEGEPGDRFHVITSGTAKVIVHGATRRYLGPDEFFGEIALIDERPRTATVVAETAVETLGIISFNFRAALKNDAALCFGVLEALCAELRATQAASQL